MASGTVNAGQMLPFSDETARDSYRATSRTRCHDRMQVLLRFALTLKHCGLATMAHSMLTLQVATRAIATKEKANVASF